MYTNDSLHGICFPTDLRVEQKHFPDSDDCVSMMSQNIDDISSIMPVSRISDDAEEQLEKSKKGFNNKSSGLKASIESEEQDNRRRVIRNRFFSA